MKINTKGNKTTAAVLAGAIVTVIGGVGLVELSPEVKGAVQTLVTAVLVFIVPNGSGE